MKKHRRKRKMQNQGNSFIMVVATLAFLSVLVTAMLVAVAVIYKLKAYDINARDNFYYLEQAMDEIYAGVGADAMVHLNDAYDDTIEVLVFFDVDSQSYVTMENDAANLILKNTYIELVKADPNYADKDSVTDHLNSFLSNPYSEKKPEGVQLSVDEVSRKTDNVTIQRLILKREAVYSTVNTRKTTDSNGNTVASDGETFVQTITTDLVIGKPEFDVNFNTVDSDLSELYEFAFVADKGVEISDAMSKVNITGNIYAAADFYNKDYNDAETTSDNLIKKSESDNSAIKYASVSSYTSEETRFKNCNGKNEKSMYSGLYIDGADVFISAQRVIVPGTIAAFNSSNLTIFGSNADAVSSSEIWADSIVLGGYSLLKQSGGDDVEGSVVRLRADAFISDDLEINAEASDFYMVGNYYGYNYASDDNRTYNDACVKANGGRTFHSSVASSIADGATIAGQAHYNSSAIIVNGQKSILDLSGVENMYIAGQAYIETSKVTKESDKVMDADGKETSDTYMVTNKNGDLEAVSNKAYSYPEMDNDNYTTDTANVADEDKNDKTAIQDYRTGEAISIKSNQLAYIPNWAVNDTEGGLYLSLPVELRNLEVFKDNWEDLAKIPIIKTVVSGNEYYFFDFSTEATTKTGLTEDVMNNFIAAYADMFTLKAGETVSQGETYGLTNITDYDYFEVEMLKVNTSYDSVTNAPLEDTAGNYTNIYSNSAISVKNETSFTIKAKSSSLTPLLRAAETLDANITEQNKFITDEDKKRSDSVVVSNNALTFSKNVTAEMQKQYKEVKWTLTPASNNPDAVQDARKMEESDITPINYFFYFNKLSSAWTDIETKLNSGYKVWASKGDVHVTADGFSDGNVKGVIICRGDVTFDEKVKSFEGLIVTGSKLKVEHSMNLTANAEIVKTVLRECDESQQFSDSRNYFAVCELFQQYQSIYEQDSSSGGIQTESAKSISAVQFEDILSYDNWLKNVD